MLKIIIINRLRYMNLTIFRTTTTTSTINAGSSQTFYCHFRRRHNFVTHPAARKNFWFHDSELNHHYHQHWRSLSTQYGLDAERRNHLMAAAATTTTTETVMVCRRNFSLSGVRFDNKDSSKVEQTVKALRESQETKKQDEAVAAAGGSGGQVKPPDEPKRTLLKRIWDEVVHYYHGFRLLLIDIGIASRLIWKVLNGHSLSRREYRQLVRTVSDVFRLVPFSVFIIVPFMELLLPVFLKFFPGMLPSTFQTADSRETKIKQELKLKLDMAKFLQTTLDEMTLQSKGESHSTKAKDFAKFFEKIRKSGEQVTNEEILKFSKLFEDEITLDSLSRPQLVALCRLLELQPIGTDAFLRFQLRMKLRSLRADDQMIAKEGVESLTVSELQQACRARGMRALGMSEDRLRFQLSQWLELSLNEKIPPALLLLSRVLYLPENIPATDQLKATIQALPDVLAAETKYKIGETEGKIDNKTKIELLKMEEEVIKRENEQRQKEKAKAKEAQVKEAQEKEAQDKESFRPTEPLVDNAKPLTASAPATNEAKKQQESVISKEDMNFIENAMENLADEKKILLLEKEELDDIKDELKDYKEDLFEFKEIAQETGDINRLKESKAARRLRKRVDKMVSKMEKAFASLESKKKDLQSKLDQLEKEGKDVDMVKRDFVSINELLQALGNLAKVSDDTKSSRILEVLDNLDIDHDGLIEVEHVFKVLELIGRENVQVTPKQLSEIINLLIQEEKINIEEKNKKLQQKLQAHKDQQQPPESNGGGKKPETES